MSTTTPPQMQFTLGDALRKSRTQPAAGLSRLSQQAMAERLHVSRPTIGAWENGDTSPPFWAVTAWAEITGWPIDWFEEAARRTTPLIHALTPWEHPRLFDFAA